MSKTKKRQTPHVFITARFAFNWSSLVNFGQGLSSNVYKSARSFFTNCCVIFVYLTHLIFFWLASLCFSLIDTDKEKIILVIHINVSRCICWVKHKNTSVRFDDLFWTLYDVIATKTTIVLRWCRRNASYVQWHVNVVIIVYTTVAITLWGEFRGSSTSDQGHKPAWSVLAMVCNIAPQANKNLEFW